MSSIFRLPALCLALLLLAASPAPARAAAGQDAYAAPPSARLVYTLRASAKGFKIDVESQLDWRLDGERYRLVNQGRFLFFSFEFDSQGTVSAAGLQPARYQETRNRKVKAIAFDAAAGQIRFAGGQQEPWRVGVQDRMSVLLQLAGRGRAEPAAFAAGRTLTLRVAGSSATDNWHFHVVGEDTLDTGLGRVRTVHLRRSRDDDDGQRIEVWLAPAHDWLPVRVLSHEASGDYLDQIVQRIER